jgi:hypothetical protein
MTRDPMAELDNPEEDNLASYLVRCIDAWFEQHEDMRVKEVLTALDDVREAVIEEVRKGMSDD